MGYKPWSMQYFRVAFKRFYRWLRGVEETPPEVAWLSSAVKEREKVLPEDILTHDKKLVVAADKIRDKTIIHVGYEGGLRVGELLLLTKSSTSTEACSW